MKPSLRRPPKQLWLPVWQTGPAGSTRISRVSLSGYGFFIGFGVHVAEHEYLAGAVVLNNGRNQPVGVFLGV